MYIHIGDSLIISDRKCIGIFNYESLKKSKINSVIVDNIKKDVKSIALDDDNNFITSSVSPFTVIKRIKLSKDFIWRRNND